MLDICTYCVFTQYGIANEPAGDDTYLITVEEFPKCHCGPNSGDTFEICPENGV